MSPSPAALAPVRRTDLPRMTRLAGPEQRNAARKGTKS